MWLLAFAAAANLSGIPGGDDPARVTEHGLGRNGTGRVAVIFPAATGGKSRRPAVFYLRIADRWCRVGTGDYLRGSNRVDRGGRNASIRLIDRQERAVYMYWRDQRLVLIRGGGQVRALDAPKTGCD